MCHEVEFFLSSFFPAFPFFFFLFFGNVWQHFMPCNDIKEMLKLYIFYAVSGVGDFGSHLITQILTSSHFLPQIRIRRKFGMIAIWEKENYVGESFVDKLTETKNTNSKSPMI